MASQKYWQDECADDNSIDLDEEEEGTLTQQEAEAIFKYECKNWIANNQEKLLNSPFATAYKKPWTKKSAPAFDGGKKKIEIFKTT